MAAFEMGDFDQTVIMGEGPENVQTSVKWSRVDPPELNPQTDSLVFQQIDVENYLGSPMAGMPGSQVGKSTLVYFYFNNSFKFVYKNFKFAKLQMFLSS